MECGEHPNALTHLTQSLSTLPLNDFYTPTSQPQTQSNTETTNASQQLTHANQNQHNLQTQTSNKTQDALLKNLLPSNLKSLITRTLGNENHFFKRNYYENKSNFSLRTQASQSLNNQLMFEKTFNNIEKDLAKPISNTSSNQLSQPLNYTKIFDSNENFEFSNSKGLVLPSHIPQHFSQNMRYNPINTHMNMNMNIADHEHSHSHSHQYAQKNENSKSTFLTENNFDQSLDYYGSLTNNNEEHQSELLDRSKIDSIMNENRNDSKWQNSRFMKFLRDLSEEKTILTENGIENNENAFLQSAPDDEIGEFVQKFIDSQKISDENSLYNEFDKFLDQENYFDNDISYNFEIDNPYLKLIQSQTQSQKIDLQELFDRGIRLMNEGKLSEAILVFEAVLQKDSEQAEAQRYLGQCCAENENEQGAISALQRCIEIDPLNLEALLMCSVSFTNELDFQSALHYLENQIEHHPDYQVYTSNIERDERERLANLIDVYRKVQSSNPSDTDLNVVLGVLYSLKSEYENAVDYFRKALFNSPSDASLWNKLGATLANGKQYSEAIKAYRKALQIRPNYVRALANLGISLTNENRHREACQSYLSALDLNSDASNVWHLLNMSLMQLIESEFNADEKDRLEGSDQRNVEADQRQLEYCAHRDLEALKREFNV